MLERAYTIVACKIVLGISRYIQSPARLEGMGQAAGLVLLRILVVS